MDFVVKLHLTMTVLLCYRALGSFGFHPGPIGSIRYHANKQCTIGAVVTTTQSNNRRSFIDGSILGGTTISTTTTARRAHLTDFDPTLLLSDPLSVSSSSLSPLSSVLLLSSSSSSSLFGDDHGLFSFGPVFLLILSLGIGAFLYANLKFTPEIIENSEQMRLQLRESEVRKLLQVVTEQQQNQQQQQESAANEEEKSISVGELREPLEIAFGMTIEEYIVAVDKYFSNKVVSSSTLEQQFTSADKELANVLRSF